LNKSFKFQSDWPYNSSQSYLLQTIITDIENDADKKIETNDEGIVVTTTTNYANNKSLVSQKIYIDKDSNVTKVEVLDSEGIVKIKMTFSDIDYDTKFDDNYFDLNSNMQASKTDEVEESTKTIDDIVYPMFLPDNTYLESETKVSKTDGERVILTFSGDKPFTLVQETVSVSDDYETVSTFGEPEFLLDTIGIVDDQTVSWISDGIEYYLTSDSMTEEELLDVVSSISQVPIEK
jgi:outer membrane lipoprotein-sorting protein